jgi:hypothetical protein
MIDPTIFGMYLIGPGRFDPPPPEELAGSIFYQGPWLSCIVPT